MRKRTGLLVIGVPVVIGLATANGRRVWRAESGGAVTPVQVTASGADLVENLSRGSSPAARS